jgi:hypothetical protein
VNEPLPRDEAQLRALTEAVADLTRRVETLEARALASEPSPFAPVDHAAPEAPADTAPSTRPLAQPTGWLAPVGRTFMVLAGAFLLRALTESGQLPTGAGVWIELAYALLWLILAQRASGLSSVLHGLSALMVGLPLILEAALRFKIFSAGGSAGVLGVLTGAALVVAARRRLRTLAALAAFGALGAAFALAFGFDAFAPFALLLIAIGLGALWIGYACDWAWLPWPTAGAANLAVLFLAVRTIATPPREGPLAAQFLHGALIVAYVGSFVVRVLLREREVRPFEVLQTAAALALGLGGSVAIAHAQNSGVASIALPCLLAGIVLYTQTFFRVATRIGVGSEFYYFGMTALALTIVGLSLAFTYPARPIVIGLGALLASLLGWRMNRPILALQGGIAAVVASAQSGLATFAGRAWLTHAPAWPADMTPIVAVLTAVAAALLIPRATRNQAAAILSAVARVILSVALVAGIGSVVVALLAPIVAGTPADPGVLATMRTIVLAISAAALAALGRRPQFVEMHWLAYAALATGAVKFVLEDFAASRPATLFIALAAYGAALIFVPKISRPA